MYYLHSSIHLKIRFVGSPDQDFCRNANGINTQPGGLASAVNY